MLLKILQAYLSFNDLNLASKIGFKENFENGPTSNSQSNLIICLHLLKLACKLFVSYTKQNK